jgi:hypothetical protein
MRKVRRQARFRQWAHGWTGEGGSGWLGMVLWFLLVLGALVLGYSLGYTAATQPQSNDHAPAAGHPAQ